MERSARVGPGPTCSSLPTGHRITSEQSYMEAEMKPISLPLPLRGNKGFTPYQHNIMYLHDVTPQQPELDTDNESDPDTGASSNAFLHVYPSSSTPLRPDCNGDPLMISDSFGDVLNTLGSETDSRPSQLQFENESNMQVPASEEMVKMVADTHSEANNVSSFMSEIHN